MLLVVDKALLDLLDRDAGVTCVKSGGVVWPAGLVRLQHAQLQASNEVDDFSGVDANGVANICTSVPPWLRPKRQHKDDKNVEREST